MNNSEDYKEDREDRRKFLKKIGRYFIFSGLVATSCILLVKGHTSKIKSDKCNNCSISSVCLLSEASNKVQKNEIKK